MKPTADRHTTGGVKMRYLTAIAIGFGAISALVASPVKAGDRLTEIETSYVGVTAASATIIGFCDVKVVKDGVLKLADRLGIDERLQAATRAAFKTTVDLPYDRSELMPSVTQLFRETQNSIAAEIEQNKPKACARWIDALRKIGTLE